VRTLPAGDLEAVLESSSLRVDRRSKRVKTDRLDAEALVLALVRRVGIVALARKLTIALWKYLERGEIPEGAVPETDRRLSRDAPANAPVAQLSPFPKNQSKFQPRA
jgi:hypothetical protein